MNAFDFFSQPQSLYQKQYEALRMFYFEKRPAIEVAEKFGYTYRGFTTLAFNFLKNLTQFLNHFSINFRIPTFNFLKYLCTSIFIYNDHNKNT